MIGFKSNQIHTVPENAFPPLLHWLILTDNKITELPKSIGDCELLQKCALAGNLLESLPNEMSNCINLELLRISANKLKNIPDWLFELPKLSWLAFGANPGAHQVKINTNLPSFNWEDFKIKELIGEGASGFISKAYWVSKQQDIAVKIFKGNVTSDGLPDDEMKIAIAAGNHENLISILGKIKNHPEERSGLLMKLIPLNYNNLGNPPSLDTCTRDVFDEASVFNAEDLLKIAKSMASVCVHLHNIGIIHGDFYAHNILISENSKCLLGDFGAATFYNTASELAHKIERIEVRAYGCLIEDVLGLIPEKEITTALTNKWRKLINECMYSEVKQRPSFSEILQKIDLF